MEMSAFEHGIERAIGSIVSGIIISAFLNTVLSDPSIPLMAKVVLPLFKIIIALSCIEILRAMKYWSTGYLIGWIVGYIIFAQTPFLGVEDYVIGIVIPMLYVFGRILR